MHTDHRLDAAPLETLVVMRVDKARHWELGCYDATKNALGFDPNQHAAEVAMWMDPYSESKIKRINGRIALGSTAAPRLVKDDDLIDEAGRVRRNGRTVTGNRPSSATRKRRKHATSRVEPVSVAPQPVAISEPPATPTLVSDPASVMPEPIVGMTREMDRDEIDAFAARWKRVNEAADARDAATRDADKTFVLPVVPPVAELPNRPPVGRATVIGKAPDETTEHTRVPFAERGKLYGEAKR